MTPAVSVSFYYFASLSICSKFWSPGPGNLEVTTWRHLSSWWISQSLTFTLNLVDIFLPNTERQTEVDDFEDAVLT